MNLEPLSQKSHRKQQQHVLTRFKITSDKATLYSILYQTRLPHHLNLFIVQTLSLFKSGKKVWMGCLDLIRASSNLTPSF